ncbi:MAG: ABC transporter ATP-binding protein [Phycisphaerae bacterium]|nr:ABC transporter ATP-binding protein [Phycisphaerae bacterium]
MITVSALTKFYQMGTAEVRALDGVDLAINEGEFVSITGASGSGKSTLMHLLGCLDRPTSGTYELDGMAVHRFNDRQLARTRNESIGFVFQTFNLINRTSAIDNVMVPLIYGRHGSVKSQAIAALERVGLADRAKHKPSELSGGERQRVAIARAIVNHPRLILADEPTGNLDSRTGEQILEIFHSLHQDGTTIVLVTHEMYVAAQGERLINMRDGKIIDDLTMMPELRDKLLLSDSRYLGRYEQKTLVEARE